MSSKLLPDALASKFAFSNSPQPSPVDALSACNVATGTPVSSDILVKFAPRETTALNSRKNIAVTKLNVFILIKLHSCREVSISTRLMVGYSREKLKNDGGIFPPRTSQPPLRRCSRERLLPQS